MMSKVIFLVVEYYFIKCNISLLSLRLHGTDLFEGSVYSEVYF